MRGPVGAAGEQTEWGIGRRWIVVGKVAGYSAALAMSLYLLVKVIWIVVGLLGNGPDDMGTAAWVVLNAVTVGMSAIGVTVALALTQNWGRRLPARPLIFFAWVGGGFLVPMLPYLVISGILTALRGGDPAPAGEGFLIGFGFLGMAAGLAVALPIYLRQRWPVAFQGRLEDRPGRPSWFPLLAVAVTVALGLLWLSWAVGGTLGITPAHRAGGGDLNDRLLDGSAGLWALVGGWSVWAFDHHRPARLPRWVPMSLAFTASGSLFAWGCWKLPMAIIRPAGYVAVDYPAVAVVQHTLSIVVGAAMLATVLSAALDRRQVADDDGRRQGWTGGEPRG
ncbi:hypothetical protein [Micromonospora sp. NPDC005174]|uniref:hypothetical protein n=1 Tax=Micromonospora sp. NPDC005174 TaxID=3157018 RepID=UPI0033AFFBF0